jgi:hypothetical protein
MLCFSFQSGAYPSDKTKLQTKQSQEPSINHRKNQLKVQVIIMSIIENKLRAYLAALDGAPKDFSAMNSRSLSPPGSK